MPKVRQKGNVHRREGKTEGVFWQDLEPSSGVTVRLLELGVVSASSERSSLHAALQWAEQRCV